MEFLTSLRAERPDLADDLDELSVFYQSELWHQISLKLESIVQSEGFGIGDTLLLLYKHFVASFGSKLNQLKLAQFAVKISERISDINERIGFLEELQKTLKENAVASTNVATAMGPQLFVEMTVLQSKLMKEEIELCKKKINEAKETLEELNNVDSIVSAKVYEVCCHLHKRLKNYGAFYKDALMFLSFSSLDSLDRTMKEGLAVDISLAALLADNVYNFGELILHPIVNLMEGTPHQWLKEILDVFNRGDMTRFEEMCTQHVDNIRQFPELVEKFEHVRQKITIMALLGLIFRMPPDERRIPLKVIGEQTKLDNDGVEFLLMRALSLHLIEGTIDQVDEIVQITWLHPRVLTMPELQGLYEQLTSWITKASAVHLELEQEGFGLVEA